MISLICSSSGVTDLAVGVYRPVIGCPSPGQAVSVLGAHVQHQQSLGDLMVATQ